MTLDPDIERQIEEHARRRGYHQPMEYLRDLLRRDQQAASEPSRGERLVAQMRGKATKGLTTDQIMAMTRE